MRKTFILCLVFILVACAAPVTETIPTVEVVIPPATPSSIPATPEPQLFFTIFGDGPIVPKGINGAWDDRFTDPGAVV